MSDIRDYYKEVDPGPPEACDGPCVELDAWCPECDCQQKHIRISQFCIECRECGEITEPSLNGE